jgi:hypothetical protein
MLKNLQQGQKLLVLRYGKQIIEDCIQLHQKKIDELGYCWFGKLGTIPSKKLVDAMLEEDKPMIILYARSSVFICEVSEVVYDRPGEGFPDYYQSELFDKLSFPNVYFKLTSIEPLDINELEKFIVVSSGNTAINTLMHSMSSFLFVTYGESKIVVKRPKKVNRVSKREKLAENDCVYRKVGKCELRGFVNFQYECDRPANCIRQKR